MKQMSLFTLSVSGIEQQANALAAALAELPESECIAALNQVRVILHQVSPFNDEPVDCVLWLPSEQFHANDYNPNAVAPPEMKLLERSVAEDGYTQPVVGWQIAPGDVEVIDGFHRTRVGKESPRVRSRVRGYLPVTLINSNRTDRRDRMAATIRHNRARGVHGVLLMTDIVASLIREGWNDLDIAKELGMDADEVLRFKQNTGMAELFKDHPYSHSWE